MRTWVAIAAVVSILTGCTGEMIGKGASQPGGAAANPGGTAGGAPPAFDIGPAPMRRLSRSEYNTTIQALFAVTITPADAWPMESAQDGFTTDISGQGSTPELVEAMMRTAEASAAAAVAKLGTILPCSSQTSVTAATCGRSFITAYGKRILRRPLAAEEKNRYAAVLDWGISRGNLADGVRLVITAMLESPSFLYRPEFGAGTEVVEGKTVARLTPYEVATRLSYLLAGGTPDDTLLAAADADALQTPEQLRAQASRLLGSAAGRVNVDHFFYEWMRMARLDSATKTPASYPGFNAGMRDAMQAGTLAMLRDIVFDAPENDIRAVFETRSVFVNAVTAPLYGLSGVTGTALQKLEVKGQPRAGILTDVGMLTALAGPDETQPIARGIFVFQDLLCQSVPPPPPNVDIVFPPVDPTLTMRQRFDMHRANPACASCHALFDPPGFALEHFDALGRYRALEGTHPIDATGSVNLNGTVLTFDGAASLGQTLATQTAARQCFNRKWFTYTFGRLPATEDASALYSLNQADAPLRTLLASIVELRAFTHRPVVQAAECSL